MASKKTTRKSGQKRLHKGALQPPIGEASGDAVALSQQSPLAEIAHAPADSGLSPAPISHVSSRACEGVEGGVAEVAKWALEKPASIQASVLWLAEQVIARGCERPRISVDSRNVWTVRDGNKKLGHLNGADVEQRLTESLSELFEQRAACTVELDWKDLKSAGTDWILWTATKAVPFAMRAVTLALMRGEQERPSERFSEKVTGLMGKRAKNGNDREAVSAETYAYWVVSDALEKWFAKSKDAQVKDLVLTSAVLSTSSKASAEKVKSWLAKSQAEACPPWWKANSLALKEESFDLTMNGRDLVATLKIATGKPVICKAYGRGSSEWADIRRIVSGQYKKRAARLVWDEERRKWLVRISFSRPLPKKETGDGILIVVPSPDSVVRLFSEHVVAPRMDAISMINWKDRMHARQAKLRASLDDPGDDFIGKMMSWKMSLDERKAMIRQHLPHVGHGARGHGKARRYRVYRALAQKEDNYVTTWCRQQASFVARVAREKHAGLVVIDDWASPCPAHSDRRMEKVLRRFPIMRLRDAIVWACRKEGLPVALETNSTECPHCGAEKKQQVEMLGFGSLPHQGRIVYCKACKTQYDHAMGRAWRLIKKHRPEAAAHYKSAADESRDRRSKPATQEGEVAE